jgi:hypothetical protein
LFDEQLKKMHGNALLKIKNWTSLAAYLPVAGTANQPQGVLNYKVAVAASSARRLRARCSSSVTSSPAAAEVAIMGVMASICANPSTA